MAQEKVASAQEPCQRRREYRSDGRVNPAPGPELSSRECTLLGRQAESPEQLPRHRMHYQIQGLDDRGLRLMGPHHLGLQAQIPTPKSSIIGQKQCETGAP